MVNGRARQQRVESLARRHREPRWATHPHRVGDSRVRRVREGVEHKVGEACAATRARQQEARPYAAESDTSRSQPAGTSSAPAAHPCGGRAARAAAAA
eukprot:3050189-Prymnesium_polylepis.1